MAESLTETFSNMLDLLRADMDSQFADLSSQLETLTAELQTIGEDLTDIAEFMAEMVSKMTIVNVINSDGKSISVKVLEKTGSDIDIRKQLNWVHGLSGTSFQAKALYWDLTTPSGVKPVQVQLCENNQTITRNFLEKP